MAGDSNTTLRSETRLRRRAGAIMLSLAALLGGCRAQDEDPLMSSSDWTFVNYWAEWCRPCIKEIPELNALDTRDGFRVLGVNFDGATGEALAAQQDALGVAFPTLAEDPAARFALARPQVLPTTLVLAPGGQLHSVLIGPQTADSLVAATRRPAAEDPTTRAAPRFAPASGNEQG
jgi:thiol-disulfide isomerase/thioredoxin